MNLSRIMTTALTVLTVLTAAAAATTIPVRRYLLSAGANNGGGKRVLLRYAESDATAFAAVLTDMGGVERGNAVVLSNPSGRELLSGIADLGKLIARDKAAQSNIRSEVFVYYSGHADESGLKLGPETLSWLEFRNAVSGLNADVRVAVLDACGSGAITRAKGGLARPAFLSDASSNMKGYAFLTSSNENEASQESDRIRGSYFTHALISGMRGAADMTGDGKVTINEAYQYAFNETLQNTQNTRAGTQHPSRDMNLAGTGDIVMTDLRETSATLSFDINLEGRLFIRDESGNLFAELRKFRGRTIELGMPPGKYSIQMEAPSRMWVAGAVEIAAGTKTALTMNDMKAMERKAGVARGDNDGIDSVDIIDNVDGIDSIDVAAESTESTEPAVSTTSTATDSSARNPSTKVLTNPLLDSACRDPYRMNFNFFTSVSAKPESGTQLAILANTAGAEFCGTQISGITNIAAKDMNGAQISFTLNIAAKRLNGAQISTVNMMDSGNAIQAGVANIAKDAGYLQAGVYNIAKGDAGYLQAGVLNIAEHVGYVQPGVLNIAKDVGYVQPGVLNIAERVGYVQAGVTNIADNAKVQAGVANIAGNSNFQAGTLNIAKKTSRQIGLINIAAHSEKTPIGLINIIGNGIFELSYYVDTDNLMGISIHTGTPWLYTLIEYAQPIGSLDSWPKAQGVGLGTRFGMTSPFYVNLDFLQMTFFNNPDAFLDGDGMFGFSRSSKEDICNPPDDEYPRTNTNHLLKLRLGANYSPIRYVTLSGGAYLNCLFPDEYGNFNIRNPGTTVTEDPNKPGTVPPPGNGELGENHDVNVKARVWAGAYVGVTVGISRWGK